MDETDIRFYRELARLLTNQRKRHRLSQTGLARRIGVSRNTICRWENGGSFVPIRMVLRIADALSCNHLILLPGREYVWRGGRVDEFNPKRPKPPEPERPIQFERDAPLTGKERVS